MSRIVVVTLFCITVCISYGQTNAPAKKTEDLPIWNPEALMAFDDTAPKPTVPKEMIASLKVADFTISLEDTKLEGMRQRFGGTIGHQGDAGRRCW